MKTQNFMPEMLILGLSDATASASSTCFSTFTLNKQVIEHPKFTMAIREIARRHERGKVPMGNPCNLDRTMGDSYTDPEGSRVNGFHNGCTRAFDQILGLD